MSLCSRVLRPTQVGSREGFGWSGGWLEDGLGPRFGENDPIWGIRPDLRV